MGRERGRGLQGDVTVRVSERRQTWGLMRTIDGLLCEAKGLGFRV